MESYEVTQALLTMGSVYHVRLYRTDPTLFTVLGELITTSPRFHLVAGEDGNALADLTANFIKTKYDIYRAGSSASAPERDHLAALVFPTVAFKKTLTLTVGDDLYTADGGVFKGVFQCKKEGGAVVLEIAKELSIMRDTFLMKTDGTLSIEVAILTAVAIHSRFYDYV